VYEINQDLEGLTDSFPFTSKARIEEHILRSATYTPIMRFILEDKVKRLFSAEQFCFMGGIDDWIYIGVTDSLGKQAKKFVKNPAAKTAGRKIYKNLK
jgi:hypothetical protein